MQPDDELRRHELRQQARGARRALSDEERAAAAAALRHQLESLSAFIDALRVGGYAAVGTEISLEASIDGALRRGQHVYFPHIEHSAPEMRFAHWTGQTRRMLPNRFGIPEPLVDAAQLVGAETLDVILLPLVAFDRAGGRLGSGAGFYDRALAFRQARTAPPLLIGVGFHCQEVGAIPMAPWDVPLDLIATDRELIVTEAGRAATAANDN